MTRVRRRAQIGSAHFDVFLFSFILIAIGAQSPPPLSLPPPRAARRAPRAAIACHAPCGGTGATEKRSLRSACLLYRVRSHDHCTPGATMHAPASARRVLPRVRTPNRTALGFGGGGCATLGGALTMFCGYSVAFLFPERCSLVIGAYCPADRGTIGSIARGTK